MKSQAFVVTPKDYDAPLNVLGLRVTVLASNTATHSYEITRVQGEVGMGPPPHSHNWDEAFYVLAGAVEFSCSGKTVVCPPGTVVHVPAGTVHSFHCLADGCDMVELTGQGGRMRSKLPRLGRSLSASRVATSITNEQDRAVVRGSRAQEQSYLTQALWRRPHHV